MNYMVIFILTGLLLFSILNRQETANEAKQKRNTKYLKISVRFLQVYFVVYILMLMYVLINFLFSGNLSLLESGLIKIEYADLMEGYEIILILLSIFMVIINFFIFELTYQILKKIDFEFKFDDLLIKRMKMISNLFIVRIFIQVLVGAVVTGSLYVSLEYVFIYALMIVLLRVFIQAIKVQEDSDLAI